MDALDFLRKFYKPEAIFLNKILRYSTANQSLSAQFCVPTGVSYVQYDMPYVSAEQFIRCISQLSFVSFGYFEGFQRLEKLFPKCMFRGYQLKFHKYTLKDIDFQLEASMRKIKNVKQFEIFSAQIKGSVFGKAELLVPF